MIAKVLTCAVVGLDGTLAEVEVDISTGLPRFNVVGLGDTAIQESRQRVRAAIKNSGCEYVRFAPLYSGFVYVGDMIEGLSVWAARP